MSADFIIYTDGSCLGNPGAGGYAAVIIDCSTGEVNEVHGGEPHTTNNRMELSAAIAALNELPAGVSADLFTDSAYLKNAFEQGWLESWKRTNWKRNTVRNQDLWIELDELVASRAVKFNWVKGHAGNSFNERCDELARTTAEKFQSGELQNSPLKKFPPHGQLSLFDF